MKLRSAAAAFASLLALRAAADCARVENRTLGAAAFMQLLEQNSCIVLDKVTVTDELNLSEEKRLRNLIGLRSHFRQHVRLPYEMDAFQCSGCLFDNGLDAFSIEGPVMLFASRVAGETMLEHMEGPLSLASSTFEGPVRVSLARLTQTNLNEATFEKGADFSGATFGSLLVSRGIRSGAPIEIRWEQFGEAWRESATKRLDRSYDMSRILTDLGFWQRNAKALGYERDVTKIQYEIIRLRRSRMSVSNPEWWTSGLLSLPNAYGARPYRPVWFSLVVIGVFAAAYAVRNPFIPIEESQRPRRPLPLFALCFSVDTFLPFVEITGVRKWGWAISHEWRWLELLERVIGVLLTTLIAYSVSSAFI